ncbi:MAG: eCIS core domain-containing protein [Solirubrobacteraceae bacterium]
MARPSAPPVQRMCAACAAAAAMGVTRPCPDCEGTVQRKAIESESARAHPPRPFDVDAMLRSLEGRGHPLEPSVQTEFGERLGADFSGVRVHSGAHAARAAEALGAVAFTHGRHVVFGGRGMDAATRAGRLLIAHELTHTVQQGAAPSVRGAAPSPGAPQVQRQEDAGASSGTAGSLLAHAAPELAEVINQGPVGWLGKKIKTGLKEAVGGLVSGLGLDQPIAALRAKLDRAVSLVSRAAKGGVDGCQAFKQILEAIHDFGTEIGDSSIVKSVTSAIDTVTEGLGKIVKFVAGGTFEALKSVLPAVWNVVSGAASAVWGWIQKAKNALGSLWSWVADKLGFGGDSESGVWAWIKRHAEAAWQSIKQSLAPIVGPLTTTAKVLVAFSPLGPVLALVFYGPEIAKVVSFLWSHRDDPDLARKAHKEMAGTFLPALLDGMGNFREKIGAASDWLIERLGALAASALEFAGGITGLPLLAGAKSLVQGMANLARDAFTWAQEKLTQGVQWVTGAAQSAWKIVSPYKEVLGSIALAIVNPPMIPLILAGWAWRAIPACYKAPIIDFILDIAIRALSALQGVVTFGPLWLLLKPAVLAFLTKLKQAQDWVKEKVSNRIAKIISGASPDFLLGFVKGFLLGVWEGLTDPFKAIASVIDGLNWVKDLLAGFVARALGLTPPPPTPKLSAIFEGEAEHAAVRTDGGGAGPATEGEAPAAAAAAGAPGTAESEPEPGPLFKDEPAAPATETPIGAAGALARPSAAASAVATTEAAASAAASPGQSAAAPSAVSSETEDGSAAPEPTAAPAPAGVAAPVATQAPAAATAAPEPPAPAAVAPASANPTRAVPGGSTLARGGAGGGDNVQAIAGPSAGTGVPGDVDTSTPPAKKAATPLGSLPPTEPATPPRVATPAKHDNESADIASRAIEEITPEISKVSTGFWPAIKEYFSSGPSMSFEALLAKLGDAWESVKSKMSQAGSQLAKKVTAFFVGNQAEEEIGYATGWLTGTISFQALLDALSAGTWTGIMGVLQSVAKFINWPMEVMGEAFKLLSKLGKYLVDGLKALGNVVKEAGGGAIRAVMEALGSLARKLTTIGEQLLGRVGRVVEREGGALEREGAALGREGAVLGREGAALGREGRALGREGGQLAKTEAERLEEKELQKGAQREPRPSERPTERGKPERSPSEEEAAAKRESKAKEKEGEPGAKEREKTAEEPMAIAAARSIDASLEAAESPAGFVRPALLLLRRRFEWITDFQLKRSGPSVFEVLMYSSPGRAIGTFRERRAPRITDKVRAEVDADAAFGREVDAAIDAATTEGRFVQGGETYWNKTAMGSLKEKYPPARLRRERSFWREALAGDKPPPPVAGVTAKDLEAAVAGGQKSLEARGVAGGLSPERYGGLVHQELKLAAEKRLGKKLAPGTELFNDRTLAEIKGLSGGEANLTVAEWLKRRGIADPGLSPEDLAQRVGRMKPDLAFREPGGAVQVLDLTSQPNPEHLAKTIFYTIFLGVP